MTVSTVRVALRIRPLSPQEHINGEAECVTQLPGVPQIVIGADRAFTFDHVFSPEVGQEQVQRNSVGIRTGSGKTFSMGTGLSLASGDTESPGVVPRAIREIWQNLERRMQGQTGYTYSMDISFLELYNEDLIDLLNPRSTAVNGVRGPTIREDSRGNMIMVGVERKTAKGFENIMECLHQGALSRTTASTDMNRTSSRSHAIFTLYLRQQDRRSSTIMGGETSTTGDQHSILDSGQSVVSKIHFVDLAGSERIKRTGAAGNRAKEGISINAGLLALGNVISALGNSGNGISTLGNTGSGNHPQQQQQRRTTHVPYRDSKLTRLLQDSLGGNSQTLMLACISPSDKNSAESLNTIRYANRARNIRNKVAVNFDKNSSVELSMLKTEIARLRGELSKLKLQRRQSTAALTGDPAETDSGFGRLQAELERLKGRNADLLQRLTAAQHRAATLENERDMLRTQVAEFGGSVHSTPALPVAALPDSAEEEPCSEPTSTRSNSIFAEDGVLSRTNVLETIDRELSEQAERHEHQIDSVRRHYESKLELVQESLSIVQRERDVALQRLANKALPTHAGMQDSGSGANGSRRELGLDNAQGAAPTKLRLPSRVAMDPPSGERARSSTPQPRKKPSAELRNGGRPPAMPRFGSSLGIVSAPARDSPSQHLKRLQDEVAQLRTENASLSTKATAEAGRLTQQIQDQAKEISRLRRQRTGRRESHRYSLLSFKENSWGVAKSAEQQPRKDADSGPKLLRAAFIKAVLESELHRCVQARQLLRERDAFLVKQDKLMNEQNDQLLRMQSLDDDDDEQNAAEMARINERIDIIDAELNYFDLKVRDTEAELAQLAEGPSDTEGDLSNSGLKMTPVLINLSGLAMRMVEDVVRIDYRAFADFFTALPQPDSTGLAYLLMQDIIEHRLVALRDEHERLRLEERLMDSRRTLLAMQRTAINAALSYERELGEAERKLSSYQSPLFEDESMSDVFAQERSASVRDANGSMFESVRERGILLRSALMGALPSEPESDDDHCHLSQHSPAISELSLEELRVIKASAEDCSERSLESAGVDRAVPTMTSADKQCFPIGQYPKKLTLDVDDISLYSGSLGVSGLRPSGSGTSIDLPKALNLDSSIGSIALSPPDARFASSASQHAERILDSAAIPLSAQTPTNATLIGSPRSPVQGLARHQRSGAHNMSSSSPIESCPSFASSPGGLVRHSLTSNLEENDADDIERDLYYSDPEDNESDSEVRELYRSGSGEFFRLPNLSRKQSSRSHNRRVARRITMRRRLAKLSGDSAVQHPQPVNRRKASLRKPRISLPIVPPEMMNYIDKRNPNAITVGSKPPLVASPELFRRMRIPIADDDYQRNIAAIASFAVGSAAGTGSSPAASPSTPMPLRPIETAVNNAAKSSASVGEDATDAPAYTPRSAGKISAITDAKSAHESRDTLGSQLSTPAATSPISPQQQQLRSPSSFYHKSSPYVHNRQVSYMSAVGDARVDGAYPPPSSNAAYRNNASLPRSPVQEVHGMPNASATVTTDNLIKSDESQTSPSNSGSGGGVVRFAEHRYLSPTERANASLFSMMDAAKAGTNAEVATHTKSYALPPTALTSPTGQSLPSSQNESTKESDIGETRGLFSKPSRIRRRAQSTFDGRFAGPTDDYIRHFETTKPDKPSSSHGKNRLSKLLNGIGLGGAKKGASPPTPLAASPLAPGGMVSSVEVCRDRSHSDLTEMQGPHVRKVYSTIDASANQASADPWVADYAKHASRIPGNGGRSRIKLPADKQKARRRMSAAVTGYGSDNTNFQWRDAGDLPFSDLSRAADNSHQAESAGPSSRTTTSTYMS
ncbi:hypothetical protein H4R20_002686 [Coemansia guatemalensis]|uniref:Kinesin motor domain-containing protein n=1 Tax=Coemansia guatemalensis TaxID=2761395 RepID=A0A9W8HV17_9FUNG|nr:hypothetical protein H4R20_002686 [Coemansia guatemalensis]